MKRVEIRVRDEAGKVISEQTLKLDIGAGRFHEIEQAIEAVVARVSGERLLSDQRIERLVIDKAVEVSRGWAQAPRVSQDGVRPMLPKVNTVVDLYAAEPEEIRLFEDGIGVKAQKAGRGGAGDGGGDEWRGKGPQRGTTEVGMVGG